MIPFKTLTGKEQGDDARYDSEEDEAAQDILYEVDILSRLPQHENIVRLFAVSAGFLVRPENGFIVLQHLVDTLHDRLARWRRQPEQRRKQVQRIRQIAPGVAKAMTFLHQHRVIYRDLKPQNIGFDSEGNVQMFDFGLARFYDGQRRLTGKTGSVRYMAPEVARSQAYGFAADVHTFSILMWEVATLHKAYAAAPNITRLLKQVAHGKGRPSLDRIECPGFRTLLAESWDADPFARPSFEQISQQLELVLSRL
jgi:serine/threonine protein kinase